MFTFRGIASKASDIFSEGSPSDGNDDGHRILKWYFTLKKEKLVLKFIDNLT